MLLLLRVKYILFFLKDCKHSGLQPAAPILVRVNLSRGWDLISYPPLSPYLLQFDTPYIKNNLLVSDLLATQ
jgi:hypothetical protein